MSEMALKTYRSFCNYVKLETSDGYLIRINLDIMLRSRVIQQMYTICQANAMETVLPMHGINHDVLLMILLWLEYHKADEEPSWVSDKVEPNNIEDIIHDWDKEFLRDKLSTVRAIMLGADYLDIPWLVKLCSRKLRMRGSAQLHLRLLRAIAPIN